MSRRTPICILTPSVDATHTGHWQVYRTIVHDQPEWHVAWTWTQPWGLKADRPSPLRVSAAEWTPSRGRGGSVPIPLRVSDVKSGRARPGSSLGRGRRASLAYAARGPCDASARVYDRTPGSASGGPTSRSGSGPVRPRGAHGGLPTAGRMLSVHAGVASRLAAWPACQWHRARPARPRELEQGHPEAARRMPVWLYCSAPSRCAPTPLSGTWPLSSPPVGQSCTWLQVPGSAAAGRGLGKPGILAGGGSLFRHRFGCASGWRRISRSLS